MKKVLVVDPLCDHVHGHFYATSLSVLSACSRAERFIVVGRKAAEDVAFEKDVTVWRWPDTRTLFDRLSRHYSNTALSQKMRRRREARSIDALIRRAGLSAGDAFVMHSLTPPSAGAIADVAAQYASGSGPSFHLRLLADDMPQNGPAVSAGRQALEDLARVACANPKVRVYAETTEVAEALETRFGIPRIERWLVPMSTGADPEAKSDLATGFVIGMLGGKREEQGAAILPDIIRAMPCAFAGLPGQACRILFQLPSDILANGWRLARAKRIVETVSDAAARSGIELEYLPAEMDNAAFARALERSHVLVLPYDTRSYGRRGSGLVIDAALSGTPIVATRGFAMREWLDMAGSPVASTASEYAAGIGTIASDYERYRTAAIVTGNAMRREMAAQMAFVTEGAAIQDAP